MRIKTDVQMAKMMADLLNGYAREGNVPTACIASAAELLRNTADQLDQVAAVGERFCVRVEAGEIKSVKTYNDLNDVLGRETQKDHAVG